jgi:hypothetical protein
MKAIRAFTELQRGLLDPHTHIKRPTARVATNLATLGRYITLWPLHARGDVSAPPPSLLPFSFFFDPPSFEPLFPWLSERKSFRQRRTRVSGGPCGAASWSTSPSASPSSSASPCCRLGPPGPRSLTSRLVALQERWPRGHLTTRPRPRPRPHRLSARRFRP